MEWLELLYEGAMANQARLALKIAQGINASKANDPWGEWQQKMLDQS